jgi:hypothetical protein
MVKMVFVIFVIICCLCLSTYKPAPVVEIQADTNCPLKPNSRKVLEALYIYDGELLTAADVAEITKLEKRAVDGIFTSAIQRKNLGIRTPAEIELDDGTHRAVKFLSLTPAGKKFADEIL